MTMIKGITVVLITKENAIADYFLTDSNGNIMVDSNGNAILTGSVEITGEPIVDGFNNPITIDVRTSVENVLVGEPSTTDVVNQLQLYGKHAQYTLAIPKGDTNDWMDAEVEFFGKRWKTFGEPIQGIEKNIPLDWNKKVLVERYE